MRYLAVGIDSWPEVTIERGNFQHQLWFEAQNLIGDVGSATVDLQVLSFSFEGGYGEAIVRTYRGEVEPARAVLTSLDAVDGSDVGIRVRGTSGTVRACEEKYMGRGPESPEQRHVVFRGAERTASVAGDRVDVVTEQGRAGATTLDI